MADKQLAISVVACLGRLAPRGMGAVATLSVVGLLLAGCGQRGPLVLPGKHGGAQAQPMAPARASSAADGPSQR